jgi:hypothetical protein
MEMEINIKSQTEVETSGLDEPGSMDIARKFHPVHFTNNEINLFKQASCKNFGFVCSDITDTKSPLFVNLGVLSNFAKLHIYYWSRHGHASTKLAIIQRRLLTEILLKINSTYELGARYNLLINQWIDMRQLLNNIRLTKKDNIFLAGHPHHPFDILEIEKIGLEHAKTELSYDIINEKNTMDLIMFSKLMAYKLYGNLIP